MKLVELIKAVKEKSLTKTQLEAYRDDLANLSAQMQFELADIRKLKAVYLVENFKDSNVATERAWAVTQKGQREIELSHYAKATETILSSLKARLYNIY